MREKKQEIPTPAQLIIATNIDYDPIENHHLNCLITLSVFSAKSSARVFDESFYD